jgi:hypothetical protein
MQVDVEMGRRPKALAQSDSAAGGPVGLETGLLELVARDHAVHHLQHGCHQLGLCGQQQAQGMGKDNTHWRTGTWGLTLSTRCAAVCPMRLAPHEGQKPRRLQEKATSL